MAKFKKGDRIKIHLDANSQFRGRIGVIEKESNEYGNTLGYMVKIESHGFARTCQVLEKDLEAVSYK
jgi:hypothetical protein